MDTPPRPNTAMNHGTDTVGPLPAHPAGDPSGRAPQTRTDRNSEGPDRSSAVTLDELPLQLQRQVDSAETWDSLAQQLLQLATPLTHAVWSGFYRRENVHQVVCAARHSTVRNLELITLQSSLLPIVKATMKTGRFQIEAVADWTVISAPVFGSNSGDSGVDGAICLALNPQDGLTPSNHLVAQVIAEKLQYWRLKSQQEDLDWEVEAVAAVAELGSRLIHLDSGHSAAMVAVNELARFLGSPRVAIGFRTSRKGKHIRLEACSGVTELTRGSQQQTLMEATLNEAMIRDGVTSLPEVGDDDACLKIAHAQLLEKYPESRIVSSVLQTSSGQQIGAWFSILPNDSQRQDRLVRFHQAVGLHLADVLEANRQASVGIPRRLATRTMGFLKSRPGWLLLTAVLLVGLIMAAPVPHRVACNCQLQPMTKRLAVAPHDGILRRTMVRPGDAVTSGQTVAIMDQRELDLQLADLTAQLETALRKRDVSRAGTDAAEIQIAELEVERLNTQIELLNFKRSNLQIKSSLDGVILEGELEDAEGAAVRKGDVLMEIAPLDAFRLEIAVPESDVSYVAPESQVTFVLEGSPLETLTGTVKRIRPASELRDEQNVFVAEVIVQNHQKQLRPGMQGRAKIESGSRPLAWILFHRPIERVFRFIR